MAAVEVEYPNALANSEVVAHQMLKDKQSAGLYASKVCASDAYGIRYTG